MIKVALILDGCILSQWQQAALDNTLDLLDIQLILSCQNTITPKKYIRNLAYYILNIFSLKNRLTQNCQYDIGNKKHISFNSIYEGNWQKLPPEVIESLKENNIEVVIKFGMSLLKIDESLKSINIFSFHHGDPREFRGRPAGFYEILLGKQSIGTIIQSISNKLDSGKVWCMSHSKVYHHSYKKTAINFYKNSRFLLRKAVINYKNNVSINLMPSNKIYRLPSNYLVCIFALKLLFRKFSRIMYGIFYEKKWNIIFFKDIDIFKIKELSVKDGKSPKIEPGYSFYADPFFSFDGDKIRLEAMNYSNGLGDIIELKSNDLSFIRPVLRGNHYSYPYSFLENGNEFLIPEVASHSSPYILSSSFDLTSKNFIKGLEKKRVVDGSLIKYKGMYYFFCGLKESASDCLYLYYSPSLEQEFREHLLNPIIIDPSRARMGGRILEIHDKIYRFGQNNCFGYGNGIAICEVTKLSPDTYEENVLNQLKLNDAFGPHTVDLCDTNSVLDYYYNKFSLFAWFRRLMPLLLKK